jgi:YfiH family protein
MTLVVTSRLLGELGVPHVFTTRHFPGIAAWKAPGGPFRDEALAALAAHGLGGEVPAHARQVHGVAVAVASAGGFQGEADVIVSERPALPVAVFTADCLPIVVYDPDGRRLALAHSGWRGTAQGAAAAAVGALAKAGGAPERFACAIGPSIGPCCYEVDAPVIARLEAAFAGRWKAWVTARAAGKWMLDLWAANRDQLVAAGLDPARIDNPRLCTGCHDGLFFSYRRQRGEGRLAAVAAVPVRPEAAC